MGEAALRAARGLGPAVVETAHYDDDLKRLQDGYLRAGGRDGVDRGPARGSGHLDQPVGGPARCRRGSAVMTPARPGRALSQQMPPEVPGPCGTTQQLLAGWAASAARTRQVAAALGLELLSQPSGAPVIPSGEIAARFGVRTAVAVQARNLLIGAGIVCRSADWPRYQVR